LILKNYKANFIETFKIYFKAVLVNEINGIINSNKFIFSYDSLYLDITLWDTVCKKLPEVYSRSIKLQL